MTTRELLVIPLGAIALVQLGALIGWRYGLVPAWACRTSIRFVAVMRVVALGFSVFEESAPRLVADAFIVALYAVSWGFPRDDDGPPRRRRKKAVEKKKETPNWTGIPVEAR